MNWIRWSFEDWKGKTFDTRYVEASKGTNRSGRRLIHPDRSHPKSTPIAAAATCSKIDTGPSSVDGGDRNSWSVSNGFNVGWGWSLRKVGSAG
ncbi:hypothetical protein TWF192_006653 [Orbilia oligospora]|nr:hypothetical protein TWF192_006653 [Orbilia oligospora]